MKYIYYPEYELEYRNLLGNTETTDHILNIRLLMFLCDHVILPPSHLLRTNDANIVALITNLQEFFDAGKIVTTRYSGGIDNYFDSRINRAADSDQRHALTFRAKQIKSELLFNADVEHNESDEEAQLSLFDGQLRGLITNSHTQKKGLILNRMDDLSNRTGEPIYSTEFERMLKALQNDGEISYWQCNQFYKFMSNAYYLSGTYTMNTPVSYNGYFQKIDLQGSLKKTNMHATNLIIDPYFLRELFTAIGINTQDIYLLRVADYKKIMAHRYWKYFMRIFERLYTNSQELDALLQNAKNGVNIFRNRNSVIVGILNTLEAVLISAALIPISPLAGLGATAVIEAAKNFTPLMRCDAQWKDAVSGKILYLLERNYNPLYEFSHRLNAAVNALKEGG